MRLDGDCGIGVEEEGTGRCVRRRGQGRGASQQGCGGGGRHDCSCNMMNAGVNGGGAPATVDGICWRASEELCPR